MMEQQAVLQISQLAEETTVLGPGSRAVIWVHGCCFRCPGCLADRYKDGHFRTYSPEEIASWYLNINNAQGLTISGGEPMLQAHALSKAIQLIRDQRDTGVIVYTGFTYEQLLELAITDSSIQGFLKSIDLLIDGPYVQTLDDSKPYRGSSNQRLIPLTARYQSDLDGYYRPQNGRRIELRATNENTVLIGVPDQAQLRIWENIKAIGAMPNVNSN